MLRHSNSIGGLAPKDRGKHIFALSQLLDFHDRGLDPLDRGVMSERLFITCSHGSLYRVSIVASILWIGERPASWI